MTPDQPTSAGAREARVTPAIFGAPRKLVAYLVFVEIAALVATVYAFTSFDISREPLLRSALLLGAATLFEEASRKSGRMRVLLSDHLKPDMTSVWSFAAAIVLPPSYAVVCVCILLYYMWLRRWRTSGGLLYRKMGSGATIVLACLSAHASTQFTSDHLPGLLASVVGIALSLLVYSATNRGLLTIALVIDGVSLQRLLGTWDDNLLEIATLCLGGLVALAVLHQPAATLLVVLPMALLQRGALVRQLKVAATTDAKTGLLNAVAWEQLAQRDLSRAQRDSEPLAVLILDLDRFKSVNDMHGHLTGDLALKAIGAALTHELRGYDTVGRFGGEEFVACLPNVNEAAALSIAERVRARINQIRISELVALDDLETDSRLAVSIGVACSPTDGTDLTDLLHAADAALYVAKSNGRNRVELARRGTGPTPETITAG